MVLRFGIPRSHKGFVRDAANSGDGPPRFDRAPAGVERLIGCEKLDLAVVVLVGGSPAKVVLRQPILVLPQHGEKAGRGVKKSLTCQSPAATQAA